MASARKVDGLGFWVGLVDDEFVGAGGRFSPPHGPDQPDDPGVADLGYRSLRCQWRKGLATAGALELVRYGFDDVRLDRIIAQTLTVNGASRAVMERVETRLRADLYHLHDRSRGGRRGGRSGVRDDPRTVDVPPGTAGEAR